MMGQIMGLARSLGGGKQSEPQESAPQAPELPRSRSDDPLSLLSGMDPGLLDVAVRVMNSCRADDDRRAALLNALRPFVQEKRYARLDQAVRIAKLTRAVRIAIDALRAREEGQSHV